MITVDDIEQVYSGKRGCMCGCQGTYRDTPSAKKLALTKMLKLDYSVCLASNCIYFDAAKRTNAIYLKDDFVFSKELMEKHHFRFR